MKKYLVLTFPEPLPQADAESIAERIKEWMPDVTGVIIDGCTSATLIEVDETAGG